MMEDQIRERMLNATIVDVIAISGPDGQSLILTFPEGDAVEISADRMHLKHDPTFEDDLAKIRIVDARTGRELQAIPDPIH